MPRNHSEMPSSGQFNRDVNERGVEDLLSDADVSSEDTGSIDDSDSRFATTITPAEAAGLSSDAHDISSGDAASSRGESDVSHQTTPEGARDDSDSNDRQTSSMLRPAAEQATPIMSGSEIHEEMQGEKFNQETQELINSDGVAWAIASALKDAAKTRSEKIRGEASTYIGAVDAVLKRAIKRQGLPSDKEEVDSSVRDVLDNSPGLRYVVEASARRGSMSKSELDELEAKLLRYNSFLAKSQAALSLDESIPSVNVPPKFEGEVNPGSETQASGSSDKQKPQRENDSSDDSESTAIDKNHDTEEAEDDRNKVQSSIDFIKLQIDSFNNALNGSSLDEGSKKDVEDQKKAYEGVMDILQERLRDLGGDEKSEQTEAESSKSLNESDKGDSNKQTSSTPRSIAEKFASIMSGSEIYKEMQQRKKLEEQARQEEQAKREREQEQEDYNAALADYARLRSERETKGSFASEKLRPIKGLIRRIFRRKNGTESRHSKREREIIEAENRLKESALKIAKRRAEAAEAVLPSEDVAQMRADLMVGALHKLLDVDVRQAINNEIAQQQEKRGFMDKKFLVPMGRWLSKGGKWTRRAKNFGVGITAGVFAPIGILTGVAAAATSAAVHRGSRLAAIDENLKRHQDAQGNAIAQLSGEEVMRKYDSYRNQSTPDAAIGDGIADFASWMLEAQRGMSHDDAKRSMKEARKNVAMIGLGFGLGKLASLGANMLLDSTDTSVTLKGTKPGNVEVHDIPKGAEEPTESLVDRLHDAANVSKPDGDTLWDIVANEIGSDKASGAIYKVTDALEQAGHTIEWINKGTDHAQVFIDGRDDVSYLYSMYNVGKSLLGQ